MVISSQVQQLVTFILTLVPHSLISIKERVSIRTLRDLRMLRVHSQSYGQALLLGLSVNRKAGAVSPAEGQFGVFNARLLASACCSWARWK